MSLTRHIHPKLVHLDPIKSFGVNIPFSRELTVLQGTYMHGNSQLSYLQDRCSALERNLLQVTAERDTIK